MPPCLYICCHFEITDKQNDPPSRLRVASKTAQDDRRISQRHSLREHPREKSPARNQRHRSHHRTQLIPRTHNHHTPTTPPLSEPSTAQTLIYNPRTRNQNTRYLLPSHDHRESREQQAEREKHRQPTPPTRAKHHRIYEWLQGMISMSSFTGSGSKARESEGGESSSVEVVVARDAKGRGQGIRVVSDEVQEGTGAGGDEGEVGSAMM